MQRFRLIGQLLLEVEWISRYFHRLSKRGFLFSYDLGTFSKCEKYYSFDLFAVILSEVVYLGWVIHQQQVSTANVSLFLCNAFIYLFELTVLAKTVTDINFTTELATICRVHARTFVVPENSLPLDNCCTMRGCENMACLDSKTLYRKNQVI